MDSFCPSEFGILEDVWENAQRECSRLKPQRTIPEETVLELALCPARAGLSEQVG